MKTIVLDPGHGDTRGAQGYDPGVVLGKRHEADAALEMGLTLKFVLNKNFKVMLTRDGTAGGKPDLNGRIQFAKAFGAAAFISLHFNCSGCGNLVYYAPGAASLELAKLVAHELGITRVVPSNSSRFRELYIDAFPDGQPSILIEFAGIEHAPPTGEDGKAQRLEWAKAVDVALRKYFAS